MKNRLKFFAATFAAITAMSCTSATAFADKLKTIGGVTYLYSDSGSPKGEFTGWAKTSKGKYYYKNGVKIKMSTTINGIRYKFDKTGLCTGRFTGWTKSSLGRRYWKNGVMYKNKWLKSNDGKYYYAGSNGYLVTGWAEVTRIGGKYSFFDSNGIWDGKVYFTKTKETITKQVDKYNGKEYIILNITPNVVYWNNFDDFDIDVGVSFDIAIPAVFEDWLNDADEMMIYLSNKRNTFGNLKFDNGVTMKGMTYPQYWSMDYLCPIKKGYVCFGEITDSIIKAFYRVDDGVYIKEANYYYKEAPFENNMSVESLDAYFQTIKNDHDILIQNINDNPSTNYDIAGFWGYQDGIRFRATVNTIY